MTIVTDKLATQVLQKAFENTGTQSAPVQSETSPFQQLLENTWEDVGLSDMLGGKNPTLQQGATQAVSASEIPFNTEEGMRRIQPEGQETLVKMLADFNQQQTHMDSMVNEILYGGKKFSNQELLAIQAHVFHVAQMTEMTVKSVELAVSSFKGVMNTQIQ